MGETHIVADSAQMVHAGFPRELTNTRSSDYQGFVEHFVQLDHRTVTSANVNQIVVTSDLIGHFVSALATVPLGKKVENFLYSRSKIKVRIVVQGAPYAAGKIVASFDPNPSFNLEGLYQAGPGQTTPINSMIVPHLVIDPSKTETYEIELPLCTVVGTYALKGIPFGSYKFNFDFITPVLSGTAVAPSVSICTYASWSSASFEGLTLLSNDFVEEKTGGPLSSAISSISSFANYLSIPFPGFAPEISLFSRVTGVAGDFLRYLGYSKPPTTEIITVPMTRHVDNWSQFDGRTNAIVLGGSQTQSLGLSTKYGGGDESEMLISNLIAKPGLVRRYSISPAASNGTKIFEMMVSPTATLAFGGGYAPTPMGGIATCFNNWSGDIFATIEVVASVFHRCTILVAWDAKANVLGSAISMADAMSVLPNTVITVSGNSSTKIRIPWAQPQPWGQVNRLPLSLDTSIDDMQRYNGTLLAYVVNPLTSNGSTDSIGLNIYFSSDNMKFAAPVPYGLPTYDFSAANLPPTLMSSEEFQFREVLLERAPQIDLEAHALEVTPLSNEFCEEASVTFGSKSDLSLLTNRSFGEEYNSVKHLASKITLQSTNSLYVDQTAKTAYVTMKVLNLPVPVNDLTVGESGVLLQTFLGYLSQAFLGYRGGIRHVFHTHMPNNEPTVIRDHHWVVHNRLQSLTGYAPLSYAGFLNAAWSSYALSAMTRKVGVAMDMIAPMLQPYDFIPRGSYFSAKEYVQYLFQLDKSPTVESVVVYVEHSVGAADDAAFVWFVGFPLIKV